MAIIRVFAPQFTISDLADGANGSLMSGTATAFNYGWTGTPGDDGMSGTGVGLTYAGTAFTGGTITSFTFRGYESTVLWSVTGLTLSATAFQSARNTYNSTGSVVDLVNALASNTFTAYGSLANDDFHGGQNGDNLRGDWGDDTFTGYNGADTIVGGPAFGVNAWADDYGDDYDTVNYGRETGLSGIVVNMTLSTGNVRDTYSAFDTLSGIEYIRGTNKADSMRGSDTSRYEAFMGGAGNDTINGGLGVDDEVRYDHETGTIGVIVNLATGVCKDSFGNTDTVTNIERVRGTARNDSITGNNSDNRFRGFAGNDTIDGGLGNDTVQYHQDAEKQSTTGAYGTSGIRVDLTAGYARDGFKTFDTLVSIEHVWATDYLDRVVGNTSGNYFRLYDGHDFADGRDGNDTILGHDGNDSLLGGNGNDSLDGGSMADLLVGGSGVDTLTGGRGWDTFQFVAAAATGIDVVTDFVAVDDTITIENGVFTALTAGALAATAFVVGAAATTAAHRIIYNQTTGALLYDADGTGATAAVQFATLSSKPTGVTAADFMII